MEQKGKQANKVNNNKLKEEEKKKKCRYAVRRYAALRHYPLHRYALTAVLKVNYGTLPPWRCSVASINIFFHVACNIHNFTCTPIARLCLNRVLRHAGERIAVEFLLLGWESNEYWQIFVARLEPPLGASAARRRGVHTDPTKICRYLFDSYLQLIRPFLFM